MEGAKARGRREIGGRGGGNWKEDEEVNKRKVLVVTRKRGKYRREKREGRNEKRSE